MPNPFSDLGVSDAQFRAALESEEVTDAKLELAERVKDAWRDLAPVDTGSYRESIHVEVKGKAVRVVADDEAASYIEFGTGGDSPTPEFAVRARVTAKFAREN